MPEVDSPYARLSPLLGSIDPVVNYVVETVQEIEAIDQGEFNG
jgi:hypothetical protein